MTTIAQAFAQWQELAAEIPQDDRPMLSESWNDYTDALCKDGELSDLQYHHAPAFDDEMPDDDLVYLLDAMGVEVIAERVSTRPGAGEWDSRASHWRITTTRNGVTTEPTFYSMGSAHAGSEPDPADVIACILRDGDSAEQDFDDWCADFGYDEDSRKAYATWEECRRIAMDYERIFSADERRDLLELANER